MMIVKFVQVDPENRREREKQGTGRLAQGLLGCREELKECSKKRTRIW